MIEYKTVAINAVKKHPRNARKGNIPLIAESLKHNGQYRPIVVDKKTNYILAGNHTWAAAKTLKWKTIEVGYITTDSEEQSLRILLADNRANDLASYDTNEVLKILKELSTTQEGLAGTLFDANDVANLTKNSTDTLLDEFPEYNESIETQHQCPKCAFEWSGKSK